MAAGASRYLAARLNGDGTETFIDKALPLDSVTVTDVLSGPPTMSATINQAYPRLFDANGVSILQRWSTVIYEEADGEIRAAGIINSLKPSGDKLVIGAVGFSAYPTGQPYIDSRYWTQVDPLDMFRHIWDHLQSQPRGNIGMQIDATTSPVRIGTTLTQVEFDTQSGPVSFEAGPYKLNWYETDDLGKAIDDLATGTPFEWREHHEWDGELVSHSISIGYPSYGVRRNDLRFALGENVRVIPDIDDGDDYATEVMLLGRGEGRAMVRGYAASGAPTLRRAVAVQDQNQASISAANRAAAREVAKRSGVPRLTQLTVRNHPSAPIGSYTVGDEIRIQARSPWMPVDTWFRVLSISRSPAIDSVALTVARTDILSA